MEHRVSHVGRCTFATVKSIAHPGKASGFRDRVGTVIRPGSGPRLTTESRKPQKLRACVPVAVLHDQMPPMEVRISSLALLLVAVLGGCEVGEYGATPTTMIDSGGGGGGGEASFNAMVKPRISTCLGCHSGGQAPNLSSFSTLAEKYKMKPGASNILVTKGDHQGITYFNATDKAAITSWINSL
jgi:hypothetical protein